MHAISCHAQLMHACSHAYRAVTHRSTPNSTALRGISGMKHTIGVERFHYKLKHEQTFRKTHAASHAMREHPYKGLPHHASCFSAPTLHGSSSMQITEYYAEACVNSWREHASQAEMRPCAAGLKSYKRFSWYRSQIVHTNEFVKLL